MTQPNSELETAARCSRCGKVTKQPWVECSDCARPDLSGRVEELEARLTATDNTRRLLQISDERANRLSAQLEQLQTECDALRYEAGDKCLELSAAQARIRELEAQLDEYNNALATLGIKRDILAYIRGMKMAYEMAIEASSAQLAEARCLENHQTNCLSVWIERAEAAEARAEAMQKALEEYADTANWYVDRERGPAHWGWLGGDPTTIAQLALTPAPAPPDGPPQVFPWESGDKIRAELEEK
jgi:DNA repair exonuclease SbcCD ATPase subunit